MRYPAPASPGPLPETPVVVPDVAPSGTGALLLRLLIALGLVAGTVQLAFTPLHRPLDDLLNGLWDGEVTTVTIERPAAGTQIAGTFEVHWDGGVRPAYSTYEYSTWDDSAGDGLLDESESILLAVEQSPAEVEVVQRPVETPTGGFRWQPGGIAVLAALFLLIGGREPRLATRWAWFWLFLLVPPAILVFVLLEPTPLWRTAPQPARASRLTGGWGFLLGLVLLWLVSLVPGYAEFFPR